MSNPIDIQAPPDLSSPLPEEDKWERERRAFHQLMPELLKAYRGQYVAIHLGQIVDSGDDAVALGLRVYAKYGYVPIFVGLVTDKPVPPVRVPLPRLVRNERLA